MATIEELVRDASGIRLDIGCGEHKQPNFVGMDVQLLPGVDIVHDVNIHPWPLPDECAVVAMCSHLVEHIPTTAFRPDGHTWFPFVEFMDEVWRVLKVGGQFAVSCPHGWSPGQLQDPTHCHALNENTWSYFDPEAYDGILYSFYKPKPWKIENLFWDISSNMEVILRKRGLNGK